MEMCLEGLNVLEMGLNGDSCGCGYWKWIGNEREVVGGYWMDWGWIVGHTGRMRMLKYFVDKYPIEICRMV